MSDKKCSYTVSDGVAVMTVDNPPVNALSAPVLTDIKSAVTEALADDSVRVVVFTGAGKKAFIAGADIKEFIDLDEQKAGSDFLMFGQEITSLIEAADKPFIAAINGFCLGGGMEFALACHIRLADEKAQIGLPEIKLGIIPGYGGTQRTPRYIGKGRALELILSGNFLSGSQAADYGIVNRTTEAGKVLYEAIELAKTIAAKSRMNIKAAIKAVNEGTQLAIPDALKLERDLFGQLCESDDKKEGVTAFLEKRDPDFKDS
ncbi:MAG: enoyl-CoA hydratase [Proteobacteria bacterium]|nr:enoyl-CoA hydratase [Pseudomonadota bacterium]